MGIIPKEQELLFATLYSRSLIDSKFESLIFLSAFDILAYATSFRIKSLPPSMDMQDPKNDFVKNLPLSNPLCVNDSCIAFYAAHNLSQKQVSYALQFQYGHWLTWYYIIFIFLFMLVYLGRLYGDTRAKGSDQSRISPWQKIQACRRFITYRRIYGFVGNKLGFPSAGLLLLLLLGVAVVSIMTFAIRPYYRQHRGYGSPPLSIRTGLMAASLTPLLVALSGKVNVVTIVTGYGYEKLNAIHRWVGWTIFALSLVHAIPFIVAPIRDGGYAALHEAFYEKGAFEVGNNPTWKVAYCANAENIVYWSPTTCYVIWPCYFLAASNSVSSVRVFLLVPLCPCCNVYWTLLLAFWESRRFLGIFVGNSGNMALFRPR